MIMPIAAVLDAAALASVRSLLAEATFEDGRQTAGWHARTIKDNEQAGAEHPATRQATQIVSAALLANPVFRAAVLPRRLRPVLFARYAGAGSYGAHVDDALMGLADDAGPMRTDVSVTVFLEQPDSYDGGELVIETTAGEQAFKLGAGDAVAYPATTLHRVAPVAAGQRLVAITWVQSLVRDAAIREMLFDIDTARRAVFAADGASATFNLLAKSYANLLRRHAEP